MIFYCIEEWKDCGYFYFIGREGEVNFRNFFLLDCIDSDWKNDLVNF